MNQHPAGHFSQMCIEQSRFDKFKVIVLIHPDKLVIKHQSTKDSAQKHLLYKLYFKLSEILIKRLFMLENMEEKNNGKSILPILTLVGEQHWNNKIIDIYLVCIMIQSCCFSSPWGGWDSLDRIVGGLEKGS